MTSALQGLALTAYTSLLRPVPDADPIWRRAARWLLYGIVYLLMAVAALVLLSLAVSDDDGAMRACTAALTIAGAGGMVAGLLALCIKLRPRALTEPTPDQDDIFVLHAWGAPRALTLPITIAGYGAASALAFAGIDYVSDRTAGVSAWLTVPVSAVWMLAVLVGTSLAFDRLVLMLRRHLARRYASEPLLVAGPAGVAAPGWGPLAWEAVRDVRLQWFTAGRNRFLMLAIDTVAPPGPDDPRAKWAHRYLHGDAFVVDLRKAVMSEHEALAAIRARRPGN